VLETLDELVGLSAPHAFEALGPAGDGLPVAAPSVELVDEMLAACGRAADETLLEVPPLRGPLTARGLAVCAALAGCEPRHLPVLLAVCSTLPDPDLNAYGFLTTTGNAAPLIVVNGPAARELGFNGGAGCLGPGNRANATVGRCLSFVVRAVGGARAGRADMATMGQPAKYTACFAENEDASPWPPLHADRGFLPGDSTATVTAIAGLVEAFEAYSGRTDDMLDSLAAVLAGSAPVMQGRVPALGGGQPIVVLSPEWATQLAKVGMTKADVQGELLERAQRDFEGHILRPAASPEDVLVIVAGGVGVKQTIVPNWNGGSRAVTRRIDAAR
jgi:hypothetical protein